MVLHVLKTLREKGLSVELWRTGGEFSSRQQDFIKVHNLSESIINLGLPTREELVEIYNAADILLAPSLYEGFGLTVLESMACGLPVITSSVSSLPEVSGDAAVLVDPLNMDEMVAAVVSLIGNPNQYQRLVKGWLDRAKLFTWEKTAEQVAAVYEHVLA